MTAACVDTQGHAGRRISAAATPRRKWLYPAIYFASFVPFGIAYLRALEGASPWPGLLLLLGMAVLGAYAMKTFLWDLADEVDDLGDALRVRRRGLEERVPLSEVRDVTFANMRPPRMTLHLRRAGRFGTRISFTPATRRGRNPFAKHPLMEELAVRAWRARNDAPRGAD